MNDTIELSSLVRKVNHCQPPLATKLIILQVELGYNN